MLALIDSDLLVYRVAWTTLADPIGIACWRMDEMLRGIQEALQTNQYKCFLTSHDGSSFRHEIYDQYKATRKPEKPVHYHALRSYLLETHGAEMVYGQEADDALGITQTALSPPTGHILGYAQAKCEGQPEPIDDYKSCIVSLDKDLRQIRGWHYNFVKKEMSFVTPEQGLRHFYMQLLMGDRIDNIPGVYGIGPVNAKRILAKCVTEEDMYRAVLDAYGGRTAEVLRNGQLLKIRTYEGELWQPPKITCSITEPRNSPSIALA